MPAASTSGSATPIATTISSATPSCSARRACATRWLPAEALTSAVRSSTSCIRYTPTLRSPVSGSHVMLTCQVPR